MADDDQQGPAPIDPWADLEASFDADADADLEADRTAGDIAAESPATGFDVPPLSVFPAPDESLEQHDLQASIGEPHGSDPEAGARDGDGHDFTTGREFETGGELATSVGDAADAMGDAEAADDAEAAADDLAIADFLDDRAANDGVEADFGATRLETAGGEPSAFDAWSDAAPASPVPDGDGPAAFGVVGFDREHEQDDGADEPVEVDAEAGEPGAPNDFDFSAAGESPAGVAAGMAAAAIGMAAATAGNGSGAGGGQGAVAVKEGLGGRVVVRKPRARKKRGVIGQLVGVVGGGLLAVPIVGGILVGRMWMGGPDTVGIAKMTPPVLQPLLPARYRRDGGESPLDRFLSSSTDSPADAPEAVGGGLDSLPTVASGGSTDEASAAIEGAAAAGNDEAGGTPSATDLASAGGSGPSVPSAFDDGGVPAVAIAAPAGPETAIEPPAPPLPDPVTPPSAEPPLAPLVADSVAPATAASNRPEVGSPGAEPRVEPIEPSGATDPLPESPPAPGDAAAAPEPAVTLDVAGLDAAVSHANESIEAVAAMPPETGRDDLQRLQLLVDWYKSLAAVAAQAAALEGVAAESGVAWQGPPEVLDRLHDELADHAGLAGDLDRLARDWLRFGNRGTEGVVLPVTFGGARRVGPYWVATASVAPTDAGPGEISVISRTPWDASPGDRMIVTGLVFQDGVVWATDARRAPAGY